MLIRSQKRLPGSGLRDHNMQWDFWTLSPESAHQVTWLLGDRGIPKSFRHMDGFSSHTYQWINAAGEQCWVKYHFKTNQGIEFLTQDEGDKVAGQSPDHHRQDLWGSIENGDFPSWSFEVQIMPFEDAETYRFNPFDLTKVWSQQDYPRIKVGTMTLNRNPQNFFAQIEQAAFEVSNFVPGVAASPDKMLQGRIFSYADAHRYRIGANYQQLPVNAPQVDVHSYAKDGNMRYSFNAPEVPVYAPNSYNGPRADTSLQGAAGWEAGGKMVRAPYVAHRDDDDFIQANMLVRESMDEAARERLVTNVVGHVSNGVKEPVLSRVFEYWTKIDAELGKKIEAGVRAKMAEVAPTTGPSPVPPAGESAKV